jgi:hypothetical protein
MAAASFMKRIPRIAALCLAAAAFAPLFAQAQGKPQVAVRCEIVAKTISDALPGANAQGSVERAVADYLAQRLAMRFTFLTWSAEPNATANAIGVLIAAVVEDTDDPMPSISIRWAALGPSTSRQSLELAPIQVYRKNDPNIATSAKGVQSDAKAALDKVVTSGFMDDVFVQFVSRIPLVKGATALPAQRVIELAVNGDDLPIGQESIMRVEFASGAAGAARKGSIDLWPFATTDSGKLGAGVKQALVDQSELPLADHWNQTLPELLSNASVQGFLIKHEPDRSRIIRTPQ